MAVGQSFEEELREAENGDPYTQTYEESVVLKYPLDENPPVVVDFEYSQSIEGIQITGTFELTLVGNCLGTTTGPANIVFTRLSDGKSFQTFFELTVLLRRSDP